MKYSLCNEVLAGTRDAPVSFEIQCEQAAALGYEGFELAPYTFGEDPHLLSPAKLREIRAIADNNALTITGLHWLLVTPPGLSIISADTQIQAKTFAVIERLIEICAALGGTVMVHGSPAQRSYPSAMGRAEALSHATDMMGRVARAAERAGLIYCIEPLAANETNFINTVEEAVGLVEAVGSSSFRTMLDTSAAARAEPLTVAETLQKWLPTGHIAHVQLNDRNRRGPGQGEDNFTEVLRTLKISDYTGFCSVEPFIYEPDGYTTAAMSLAYLRGIEDALDQNELGKEP